MVVTRIIKLTFVPCL